MKFDNMDDEKHYMNEDIHDMNEIVFMDWNRSYEYGVDCVDEFHIDKIKFINRQNHVHYIRFYNFDAQP
jgi:hypothetical protein